MNSKNHPAPTIMEWSPHELAAQVGHCEMIDVREADEFIGPLSHIKEAKLVSLGPALDKFLQSLTKAPPSLPIVFICRSGARSMKAALQAHQMGLTRVINLKGGMIAWNDSKVGNNL